MNIDWSKAPEGAEIYLPNQQGTSECFVMFRGDEVHYAYRGMTRWTRWAGESKQTLLSRFKYSSKDWNGEGLPPVGTVCEALMPPRGLQLINDEWVWRKVEVVKSGMPGAENECLVFDVENTAPSWVDQLRPIRTPEQIASQERDAALNEMIRRIKDHPQNAHGVPHITQLRIQEEACIDLYEAGYRLQVKE